MDYPPLIKNYLAFCRYKQKSKNGIVDLIDAPFLCPTTILPLANLIQQTPQSKYIPPKNTLVKRYFELIINEESSKDDSDSFIPVHSSKRLNDADITHIYKLISKESKDEQALKYIISELVANINEHSNCTMSSFMAQNYKKRGFLEAAFFDNGKTIPGSFKGSGFYDKSLEDSDYVGMALEGKSTKEEKGRGWGLPTTIKILKAMNSDIFIVSGKGAIYLTGTNKYLKGDTVYKLSDVLELSGTLIAFQIHLPLKHVSIYDYIQ